MATAAKRMLGVWAMAALTGFGGACGSRTGLFGAGDDDDDDTVNVDGGRRDGSSFVDGGEELDALPPIDVAQRPDVDRRDCPDADTTYVYVVTAENELYSFYPPEMSFKLIGLLACPVPQNETPFSMGVDRKGVAYVVFTNGELFRVSTATAACIATPYTANQLGWDTFGMGFVSDNGGPEERLFISGGSAAARGLGFIDPTTFRATQVGTISPALGRSELTGTGDGRLFAFSPNDMGSSISEINKANARVIARTDLSVAGGLRNAFAFAYWGGDFWIFWSPDRTSTSQVAVFEPSTGTTTVKFTHPSRIVGAGVSTCAPQQ